MDCEALLLVSVDHEAFDLLHLTFGNISFGTESVPVFSVALPLSATVTARRSDEIVSFCFIKIKCRGITAVM
jgi:hypothetical protein